MRIITTIMPGLLVAATGVGAGDLATASIVGSLLGLSVLWAVIVGGVMKYFLTEGIGRWQLATDYSLLEGVNIYFGRLWGVCFFPYLMLWSFFVGAALMSACGVTLNSLVPVFSDANLGKYVFAGLCSLTGLVMIKLGGFKAFEKIMSLCIGLMFVTVVATATVLAPPLTEVLNGLFIPSFTPQHLEHFSWIFALIGGVGGTVTILCYGYWIREKGRTGKDAIAVCRLDLVVGYSATVIFGLAMVVIGSRVELSGSGANLLVQLAAQLEGVVGSWGKWVFLVGAFGAVFSSLLGVWQAVPTLCEEAWRLFIRSGSAGELRGENSDNNPDNNSDNHSDISPDNHFDNNLSKNTHRKTHVDTGRAAIGAQSRLYNVFLVMLATVPLTGLMFSFKSAQKFYSVTGSLFIPLVALTLLLLNNSRLKQEFRNGAITNIALVSTLVFFGYLSFVKLFG